ncbi:MAG: trimeric intracellular cation channel family protein [Comamonas sp.]
MGIVYLIAITAEAASGAIMGMRRNMDLFGIAFIGSVTALGGGSVRDMLLGHYPLGWVTHPEYLAYTIGAAVATAALARQAYRLKAAFLVLDAMGLVAFTVIGCDIAAAQGVHVAIVVLMGLVTGIFGGLLRDVLCNQVPLVLQRDLYASVSLVTGVAYVGLQRGGLDHETAMLVAVSVGFVMRMLAIRYKLALPVFKAEHVRGFDDE